MRVLAINADKYEIPALLKPIRAQLHAFARRFLTFPASEESESQGLQVLWYSTFTSIYADLDLLEKRVGREGAGITTEENVGVLDWAESCSARAAVVHALLVKKQVKSMKVLYEPAIHVPRSLFSAGVVLFCYSKFASQQ